VDLLLPEDAHAPSIDRVARRVLDVVIAAVALIALSPLLAIISVAVILESPGPVLYRAERVGRDGRSLRLLKFRKMPSGASGLPLTVDGDSRLTSIGRWLSRWRLDELPQLWQVLTGELSLVGPRPEDPVFVRERSDDYAVILQVRPGVTGLTQLAFSDERRIVSSSDPIGDYLDRLLPQKCALDRLYVQRASLVTNVKVLAWTVVPLVLRRPVSVDRMTGAIALRRRPAPSATVLDLTQARQRRGLTPARRNARRPASARVRHTARSRPRRRGIW
jgi:lipopolysaccharide/colanic/teichoic acid biosynthesis glycosyltransferase